MAAVPRISVVVPIYNVEDYLEPCLRSVAEQTVTDLDVVMETRDSAHVDDVIARLEASGFRTKLLDTGLME